MPLVTHKPRDSKVIGLDVDPISISKETSLEKKNRVDITQSWDRDSSRDTALPRPRGGWTWGPGPRGPRILQLGMDCLIESHRALLDDTGT